MESKPSYLSKSMWVGLLTAVAGLLSSSFPSVNEWISGHNDAILMGLGVIGMVLRAVSKDKIVLW